MRKLILAVVMLACLNVWTPWRGGQSCFAATGGGSGAGAGSRLVGFINARSSGLLGGANDDTARLQALLNANASVYLPGDTNYTLGTIYLTNGNRIFGDSTKISMLASVSNAAMFDWKFNTNIVMNGLVLDGGAYGGTVGTTNRQGIAPYAYAGGASYISDCVVYGFDYGIRPVGDKTTTTSHQSPTLNIHDITCYSNFCGIYFSSPDASHVVEYLTVNHVNSFQNFWGALIDAGNIDLVGCDLNNNNFGFGMPGTGVNNSHGSITGSKINHNIAGFAITNIISGEIIIGNQFNANTDVGFIHASRGVNLSFNHIASGNLWVVQGSANTRNYVWFNNADGFGGGSGATFTVLDFDGTASHGMNNSILDSTGDGFIFYGTNMPGVQVQQELTHTNSFSLINSNASGLIMVALNNGTGTRIDRVVDTSGIGRVTGSDATTTGQSLADVTGLAVPLQANSVYQFEAVLSCNTSAVTTGTQYGMQYSVAGATIEAQVDGPINATTGVMERISAFNTANATALLTVSSQNAGVTIKGTVTTGANAGNLTVRHLKVTSGTSTVRIGSTLNVKQIL